MTNDNLELKKKFNIWEKDLHRTMAKIIELSNEDSNDWTWAMNSKCKYLNLRIDMRDGGHVIMDREGNRISLEDVEYQYTSEEELTEE
jgi:hypothetical protein